MRLRYGPRALADLQRLHAFVAGEYVLHHAVWGDEEVIVLRIWHGRETR